jgi:hypothetical protein
MTIRFKTGFLLGFYLVSVENKDVIFMLDLNQKQYVLEDFHITMNHHNNLFPKSSFNLLIPHILNIRFSLKKILLKKSNMNH